MIFNCKQLAEKKIKELRSDSNKGLSLGVVQIGKDNISETFVREKRKIANRLHIGFNYYKLPENILFEDLKKEIKNFPDDGILVQLPIKGDFKTQKILNLIPFKKDVDVLSEVSLGKLFSGRSRILPPVVSATKKILTEKKISLKGSILAVIGPGRLVGKPMISYGIAEGATIISVNKKTKNPKKLIKMADVVVSGVGKSRFITGDMIKRGAVVIDAGSSEEGGSVVGDVDTDSVKDKARLVTPVPGGVGPLTVVSLFENLIKKTKN